MKKLYIVLALAGVLSATSLQAAFDGKIGLTGGAYQNGSGGEFNATTTGSLGNFVTFCLEYNEHIVLNGNQADYRINSGSVAGGISGQSLPNDPYTGLTMDRISWGTAWLYSQFRAGTLDGGAYFTPGNRYANAGTLQNAIWYLEGEGGAANYYYTLANNAAILAGKVVTADSAGAFGVVALNLFNGQSAQAMTANGTTYQVNQDMLAIVPEASTVMAGALLLLPFGASTIRILRKNRAA